MYVMISVKLSIQPPVSNPSVLHDDDRLTVLLEQRLVKGNRIDASPDDQSLNLAF